MALVDFIMLSTINRIKQKTNILNLRLEKYVLLIYLEQLLHLMAQKRYLETSMFGF